MDRRRRGPAPAAVRITLTYTVAATAWILVSDRIVSDASDVVQSVKGVAFVAVTSAVLLVVMAREFAHREQIARMLEHERTSAEQLFAAAPEPAYVFDVETQRFLAVNDAAVARYGWTVDEFLGMTLKDIRPAEEHDRLDEALRDLSMEHRDFGLWCHRTKEGRLLDVRISAHGIVYEGRRAELVVARDETELVRAARAQQVRHRRQSAVAEISTLALADPVLSELFERACAVIAADPAFDSAAVVRIDGAHRTTLAAAGGWSEAEALSGVPLATASGDTRAALAADDHGATRMFAAIIGRAETFGALAVRAPGDVDTEMSQWIETLSHTLGTAVARREMRDALARAEEAERQRISEDIHDDPLQLVIAVGMRLQLLCRRQSDPELGEQLESLLTELQRAVERLRSVMFELHPQGLRDDGLAVALERVLARLAANGTTYAVEDHTSGPIPNAVATTLFRSAREAVLNANRHAAARHIGVTISSRDGGTAVRVRDDGAGFDGLAAGTQTGHLGLVTMRERMSRVGGRALVESRPGQGTTVELWVPHASVHPDPDDAA